MGPVDIRFTPVGRCIYCGGTKSADDSPLTDEHIIPAGMGGRLVLPTPRARNAAP